MSESGVEHGITAPTLGARAPEFSARTHYAEQVQLEDLAGAPSALVFYPFAFSTVCGSELRELQGVGEQLCAMGSRVLAISCDAVHTLRAYAEDLLSDSDADELGLTLVSDFWPHGAMARSYGCFDQVRGAARRLTVILDPQLRVHTVQTAGLGEQRDVAQLLCALREAASPEAGRDGLINGVTSGPR
ncbi:redoxin domain-containing protein [Nesterenkonia aerolata]|uniref:Redoxin domain-containing protein n=1 Tax=Nesterenkonia aerolata TaxID=3074079 RepID=A0ABU2DV13_9MICC|nr:redoxin domain-containing protein [Nesterenkonia sp. LY-0111]MDR8020356.1 redoxin domain-containing protein [Nesterenkonia sp. LY-0111]